MPQPRIFVGTLACGEAEFQEASAAIKSQSDVSVTHHVISGEPEYRAHNLLWKAWADCKASHDLFVKVDADTILNRKTALAEIFSLFSVPEVTGAQILLQDYFTDDLISGLNAFSPRVEFRPSRSRLFADHADFGHQTVLKGEPVRHLAPIGWHCKNPHPYQAFHYGFHRGLKKQKEVLRKVAKAWLACPDTGREWALAGAASIRWWHNFGGADYRNESLQTLFSRLQDDGQRCKKVKDFIPSIIES